MPELRHSSLPKAGTELIFAAFDQADRNIELQKESRIDPLTGLPNRRAYGERQTELQHLLDGKGNREGEAKPYSIMILSVDGDGLGEVNNPKVKPKEEDEKFYGQVAGDRLIQRIAGTLAMTFREGDIFRRGGDEFIGFFVAKDEESFEKIHAKIEALAIEHPKLLRAGLAFADMGMNLVEVEEQADPKTHPENKITSANHTQ